MFKKLLNTIRAKVGNGSVDNQGNYYSRQDDEKLAARQTLAQQIRTVNPTGDRGREQPNNPAKNIVYSGVVQKPNFLTMLKQTVQKKPTTKTQVRGGTVQRPAPRVIKQVQAQDIKRVIPSPTPTPSPKIPSSQMKLKEQLDRAFERRGNPPLATTSAHMAQEGMRLQKAGLDPRMIYAIGIKETGGLKSGGQKTSNAYGIGPHKNFATPNDATTYFTDLLLKSHYYDDYRKTKKPIDLLKRYTPVSDPRNPGMRDQMNSLMQFLDEVK